MARIAAYGDHAMERRTFVALVSGGLLPGRLCLGDERGGKEATRNQRDEGAPFHRVITARGNPCHRARDSGSGGRHASRLEGRHPKVK